MKVRFENVGRMKKTWTVDYPLELPLATIADDEAWWMRQLRGVLRSDPGWFYSDNDDCVYVMAGFNIVGRAAVVKD